MAIAFDNGAAGTNVGGATTNSVTFSLAAGATILFATTWDESALLTNDVTGVTWNSVAMTIVDNSYNTGQYGVTLWSLTNPATGSHTLTATRTSTSGGFIVAGASYTGASGTVTDHQNARETATFTLTGTSTVNNSWGILAFASGNNITTVGTNTTQRVAGPGANTQLFLGDTNSVITPAGSYTMGLNGTFSSGGGAVLASFSPTAVASIKALGLLGIG